MNAITPTPGIDQEAFDRAANAVRRLCGWHIFPIIEETITLDSPGDSLLVLPTKNLVEIINVTIDGTTYPLSDFRSSPDGLLVKRHGRFPRGIAMVTVTMKHGYEKPTEILGVINDMARRANESNLTQLNVGGISVGATNSATPQSSEWRIVDELRLGPLP
ncbi:hypothetical protein FRC0411_00292 [Corynebacterium diphtheriae]|nr:hypothetical protein FRC0411_00292 [Corynebacterium diphtheriae]CAB0982509.1 hypothetical protein FRC0492_00234 [Corynebacterium diphtheriae]CAB0995340.1 hypothetical protein FRC0524_00234 [Corynebacterium diphtheriae]